MKIRLLLLAALVMLVPLRAHAQDEDSSTSDSASDGSDSTDSTPAPRRKHKKHRKDGDATAEEELAEAPDPSKQKLARIDEPRIGLGVEAALSLDLLDKSAGPGFQGVAAAGLRVNWAPGVLWTDPEDEFWRYALLAELSYDYTGYSDGTTAVNTSTKLHYLNAHVMFGYPAQKLLLFYGALGPGMVVESVNDNVQGTATPLTGIKFLLAYGAGARLTLQANDRFSIAARMEVMGEHRGYMQDVFLTFGVGGAF
ncbi:MAG: hypothetical protein JST54_07580 [Deltaproteobacteria bacterium]|nr:hypothetical protein [Deltaproteobacteria bacterium]